MSSITSLGETVWVTFMGTTSRLPSIGISRNGGKNWNNIPITTNKGNPTALAINPNNHNLILMSGYSTEGRNLEGFMFISEDGGDTWSSVLKKKGKINENETRSLTVSVIDIIQALSFDPSHSRRLYYGSPSGIFRSEDNGKTWNKIYDAFCNSLCIKSDGTLYASTEQGVIYTSDHGQNWITLFGNDNKKSERIVISSTPARKLILDERNNCLYLSHSKGLTRIGMK